MITWLQICLLLSAAVKRFRSSVNVWLGYDETGNPETRWLVFALRPYIAGRVTVLSQLVGKDAFTFISRDSWPAGDTRALVTGDHPGVRVHGNRRYHAAQVLAGRHAAAISWRKYVTPSASENRRGIRNATFIR